MFPTDSACTAQLINIQLELILCDKIYCYYNISGWTKDSKTWDIQVHLVEHQDLIEQVFQS